MKSFIAITATAGLLLTGIGAANLKRSAEGEGLAYHHNPLAIHESAYGMLLAELSQNTVDEVWHLGIEQVKPGNTFGDIGAAIQRHAEALRCSVVRDFCGHGLGRVFHAAPNVLHYGRPGSGARLEPGMFFTIEPMINLGRPETKVLDDDWTAVTRDRSLSAQFEHSVGVTETGVEIFTLSPADRFHPTWDRAA